MPVSYKMIFLKGRLIHFHINNTTAKRNQLSFSNILIKKLFPTPVHSVS